MNEENNKEIKDYVALTVRLPIKLHKSLKKQADKRKMYLSELIILKLEN